MEKNYRRYTVEDFTQDLSFIKWIKEKENEKFWITFIKKNPDQKQNIHTAREIVGLFKTVDQKIKTDDMYSVWKRTEAIHNQFYPVSKKKIVFSISRYAAIFVLPILLGGIIWKLYTFNQHNHLATTLQEVLPAEKHAKLILDDGGEVFLKQKQTNLHFNQMGDQIMINEDSVIHHQSKDERNAMSQIIIPYGRTSKIELSDGTVVWMNAGSKLLFPQKFEGKRRRVFLVGEAYFEVAKDKTRAFTVTTPNIHVTVLGTHFNLRDNPAEEITEVVLVEGAVGLKENGLLNMLEKEIKLSPRQRAYFNKDAKEISVESDIDVDYYTSWREGLLMFERESILNVFKRLEQYYDVHFITDKNISVNQKFSGKLDLNESLESILSVLSDAAPITYKTENKTIYINNKR